MAESVKNALQEASFTIAQNRDEASITLRLVAEEQKERVVSVRSTGRVSELELSHSVNMAVVEASQINRSTASNDPIFNRVEVFREYTYDETGVLGKENEARILRAEMEQELVRQIVLRTIANLAPSITSFSIDPSSGYVSFVYSSHTASNLHS